MAPLLLPFSDRTALSIVAGATHRVPTVSDLRQGPSLQGVASGVVAGFDGDRIAVELARPDRVSDGTNDREPVIVVMIGRGADSQRPVGSLDVPGRLCGH